ncbi:Aste57867_15804 [Aphanomyces stellatus]|uniref:MORN repeat-containing protein 3 n=1 Tax=Aphanomyces stellatus TaxID=120398 RepID=A0A485L4A5_9STRA|nr:hypothetical protein As57867_015748 [Aphanomyces stellatus]VFT92592.1 Aste57867_15804 [Aphanomyces stellatus]
MATPRRQLLTASSDELASSDAHPKNNMKKAPHMGTNPLWKTWDAKSVKTGSHHSVYWVKQGPRSNEDKYGNVVGTKANFVMGAKYTGDWDDDQKSGYGTQVCASGNKYEGEWDAGQRHGKGTFWVKRGGKLRKQYTGDWVHDKRHGLGVYYYEDGGKYEGFWATNARQGKGRMTYPDGAIYEGHWAANERSGMGVLSLPNGNRYEGYWMHDLKEGPGRFYYKSTNKVYEAEWQADAPKCGTYHDMTELDPTATETFELPALELDNPESVLNDTIMQLRDARLQSAVAAKDDSNDAAAPDVYTLPPAVRARVQDEFAALDYAHRGVIRCVDVVEILQRLDGDDDDSKRALRVQVLLAELGASYDTQITLPECMDIMALLMEPTAETKDDD